MDYNSLLSGMTAFGASVEEICFNTLGVSADNINEKCNYFSGMAS